MITFHLHATLQFPKCCLMHYVFPEHFYKQGHYPSGFDLALICYETSPAQCAVSLIDLSSQSVVSQDTF